MSERGPDTFSLGTQRREQAQRPDGPHREESAKRVPCPQLSFPEGHQGQGTEGEEAGRLVLIGDSLAASVTLE